MKTFTSLRPFSENKWCWFRTTFRLLQPDDVMPRTMEHTNFAWISLRYTLRATKTWKIIFRKIMRKIKYVIFLFCLHNKLHCFQRSLVISTNYWKKKNAETIFVWWLLIRFKALAWKAINIASSRNEQMCGCTFCSAEMKCLLLINQHARANMMITLHNN